MPAPSPLRHIDPGKLGASIVQARKRVGLNQAALAEAIGVSRPTLIAIETGQRAPTPQQLADLAKTLDVRVRDLLTLEAPDQALAVRFRGIKGGRSVDAAVTALQELGRRYVTLERLADDRLVRREPGIFPVERIRAPELAAEELATAERLRLGLGDGPLPDLRSLLEKDAGLRIFGLPELNGTRISGLFAYSAELGPLVGFNLGQDPRRTRWTLCHEHAHFLTNRYEPEVTEDLDEAVGRRDRIEVFANRFAACFLMPTSGLSRRFSEMVTDAEGHLKVAHLVLFANFYDVSFQALVQRLEELGRIPRHWYESVIERGLKPLEAERALGIQRKLGTLEPFPVRYVYLVARLYGRGSLSEGDVAAYLRTDRLEARAILERVPLEGEGADDEVGLDTPVEGAI